jgi:hypothetical protein
MDKKVIEARDALKRIFIGFPQSLELREVRAHIYQAYQKIDHMEKIEERRTKSRNEQNAIKSSLILPYTNPLLAKQALTAIDEMIEAEEKKIDELRSKKKGNKDDDNQTYFG